MLFYCATSVCDARPILNQHFVSVRCLLGSSHCQYAWGMSCFLFATVTQPFVSQTEAYLRALVNYLLLDVVQAYRLSMIWEFALNAALHGLETHIVFLSWLITADERDMSLWNIHGPLLHSGDPMSCVF